MDTLLVLNQLLKKDAKVIKIVQPILHASIVNVEILATAESELCVKLSIIDRSANVHQDLKEIRTLNVFNLDATQITIARSIEHVTKDNA